MCAMARGSNYWNLMLISSYIFFNLLHLFEWVEFLDGGDIYVISSF